MSGQRWVAVGQIVKTHGIRGALVIAPYGETLSRRQCGQWLFVQAPTSGVPRPLRLVEKRPLEGKWLVRLEGVEDVEAARCFVGLEVGVPEEDLAPLEAGEYYHHQLMGLRVLTPDGVVLGRVVGILETRAHDLYVVETDSGREALVPAVAEIVHAIDVSRGVMVVDPPEGLFE
ncbi:ribosome maturation factor RimM [Desulfosoma caldarium]|uniref:Ribosome maturation factor RimM n=1 Tax=Desulfosoma caldarium TaxID=610254 RepID=A0A3N1VN40_9BACT|nr:ribosome maturation factor RimM [Desulfosoma caldarium]ROR01622.1 16S rRNA processing protein RimM [Desulfosoma caldarium]